MSAHPLRIQRRRTKGWRKPPNTICVSRPSVLGNPFTIAAAIETGFASTKEGAQALVVECFKEWLANKKTGRTWWDGRESEASRNAILALIPSLRGKSLACWCRLDQPCHADHLLELANR